MFSSIFRANPLQLITIPSRFLEIVKISSKEQILLFSLLLSKALLNSYQSVNAGSHLKLSLSLITVKLKMCRRDRYTEDLKERINDIPHPQVGEIGIYHVRKKGNELRESEPITFGLIGNQNSGKTTLFNQLTGSNQHVGNFPGVTVDRKDGIIKNHPEATVTDLPGIYSLSPYTDEEIVTRDFLINNRPRGIINIVDATNIERNLYLTMQLIEMDIPMVLARCV